jgi:hypothetical protein
MIGRLCANNHIHFKFKALVHAVVHYSTYCVAIEELCVVYYSESPVGLRVDLPKPGCPAVNRPRSIKMSFVMNSSSNSRWNSSVCTEVKQLSSRCVSSV